MIFKCVHPVISEYLCISATTTYIFANKYTFIFFLKTLLLQKVLKSHDFIHLTYIYIYSHPAFPKTPLLPDSYFPLDHKQAMPAGIAPLITHTQISAFNSNPCPNVLLQIQSQRQYPFRDHMESRQLDDRYGCKEAQHRLPCIQHVIHRIQRK